MTKTELKRRVGRKELLAFQSGKRLAPSAAIKAYCYCCMSEYADGAGDCGDKKCPLHPFMPFNKEKQKSRVVTEATREKMKAARAKIGKGKDEKSV